MNTNIHYIPELLEKDYASLEPQGQLRRACVEGDCARIQAAIDAGADVREYEYPSLRLAAAGGHIAALQLLLRRHARRRVDKWSVTMLREAIINNHRDAVILLMAAGVDRKDRYASALGVAAMCGNREMMRLLLDLGASVKHNGNALVDDAARNGDLTALEMYLSFGGYLKNPEAYSQDVRAVVEKYGLKNRVIRKGEVGKGEGLGL